jgi:membrane associated rhomboid family serine protease
MMKVKIKYNAPVTLTFAFVCVIVLVLNQTLIKNLTLSWFAVGGRGSFHFRSFHSWITLFTHIIGHAGWNHLISNFSFILLIGPILELTYGSLPLLFMIGVTALVTGALNSLFFPAMLLGASGVVFMMILLASFTNFKKGEIPLTFILILVLYIGQELFSFFRSDNISQFAHIAGGFCGSLFGFLRPQGPGITPPKSLDDA